MGELTITREAAQWFKDEMGLESGDSVQFFVKIYGGIPTGYSNFFLGVSVGKSTDMAVTQVVDGITFFFSDRDAWFLDEVDMKVVKEKDKDEVDYLFEKK